MGITMEGSTHAAALTFTPRKGKTLDHDAVAIAILQLRTKQVGARTAALSIDEKLELTRAGAVCRVHYFPSQREKRATTFDRRMETIAQKIAKQFRCGAQTEIQMELEIDRRAFREAQAGIARSRRGKTTSRRQGKCHDPYAVGIRLAKNGTCLRLRLEDGREFYVPFAWYPPLRNLPHSVKRRMIKWSGVGVSWPGVKWDMSTRGMVADCIEHGVEPTYWCCHGKD